MLLPNLQNFSYRNTRWDSCGIWPSLAGHPLSKHLLDLHKTPPPPFALALFPPDPFQLEPATHTRAFAQIWEGWYTGGAWNSKAVAVKGGPGTGGFGLSLRCGGLETLRTSDVWWRGCSWGFSVLSLGSSLFSLRYIISLIQYASSAAVSPKRSSLKGVEHYLYSMDWNLNRKPSIFHRYGAFQLQFSIKPIRWCLGKKTYNVGETTK